MNDKDTFRAGDIVTINIKVLEHADKLDKNAFKPALTVNGTMGNSSYVSGVHFDFEGDLSGPRIYFTVIMAGLFNVIIEENDFKVFDSSMHFQVQPGVVNSSRLSELDVILLCICAYPFPRTRNPPEDYLYSICPKLVVSESCGVSSETKYSREMRITQWLVFEKKKKKN